MWVSPHAPGILHGAGSATKRGGERTANGAKAGRGRSVLRYWGPARGTRRAGIRTCAGIDRSGARLGLHTGCHFRGAVELYPRFAVPRRDTRRNIDARPARSRVRELDLAGRQPVYHPLIQIVRFPRHTSGTSPLRVHCGAAGPKRSASGPYHSGPSTPNFPERLALLRHVAPPRTPQVHIPRCLQRRHGGAYQYGM